MIDVVIPYKTNTRIPLGVNTPNVCNTDPRVGFAFTTIQWAQQKSGMGWVVGYKYPAHKNELLRPPSVRSNVFPILENAMNYPWPVGPY